MTSRSSENQNSVTEPARTQWWNNAPNDVLIILPLRNTVLFPSTVTPLSFGRPASVRAVQEAVKKETPIGVVAQKEPGANGPTPQDIYWVGSAADILRVVNLPGGQSQILVQGWRRFKILDFIQTEPYMVARVNFPAETVPTTKDFEARVLHLRQESQRALSLLPEPVSELAATVQNLSEPSAVIDVVASFLDLPVAAKQEILETFDLEARAQKVTEKLTRQIEVLELTKKIGSEAKDAMDRSQREYILRQQLKAIQKELGEADGKVVEVEELRKRFTTLRCHPKSSRKL